MPLAIIYTRFAAQITNLQTIADNNARATQGLMQRQWRIPDSWDEGVFDIAEIAPPFTRNEINIAYPKFYDSPSGTVNDAAAAKWQAVHLSGQERAFRMQLQSGIRCAIHASGRRSGQSDPKNGSFARIVDHVVDMIVAGGV